MTTVERKVVPSLDCLPVTALHTVVCTQGSFLLSGSGASLSIFQASGTYPLILKTRVFASQIVHGITSFSHFSQNGLVSIRIVVWGGRCLSFLRLTLAENPALAAKPAIIEAIWSGNLGDWILHVIPYDDSEAVLLTAHNTLYKFSTSEPPVRAIDSVYLGQGIETLLYSGQILVLNNGNILVASGTVFGEILVWLCGQLSDLREWTARTKYIFLGHQGSIFGVALSGSITNQGRSHRLLASCSDDRTIRLWDVSECDLGIEGTILSAAMSQDTGFGAGHGDTNCLAMGWGHMSRIWNIQFVNEIFAGDDNKIHILSRGEDAMCQAWMISLEDIFSEERSKVAHLQPTWHDHQHAGKNVWSMLHFIAHKRYFVITGGADGQIAARSRPLPSSHVSPVQKSITFQQVFKVVHGSIDNEEHSSFKSVKAMKQYLITGNKYILATTDQADMLCCNGDQVDSWLLLELGALRATITLATDLAGNLAFYTKQDGALFAYETSSLQCLDLQTQLPAQASSLLVITEHLHSTTANTIYLLATFYGRLDPILVSVEGGLPGCKTTLRSLEVKPDFVISSAYYDALQDILICGSRSGALAVFADLTSQESISDALLYHRHAHGSDAVTSIKPLPSIEPVPKLESWWLSTGRDGTFAVWQICKGDNTSITCVHRSSPPIGPKIEGVYFNRLSQNKICIVLYGFRSKEFVVWDESNQHQVLAVDCGGARRAWAYWPGHNSSDSIFVWTRAGVFNIHRDPYRDEKVILQGNHGREIKAVAISRRRKDSRAILVATAAEDTDIRVFKYSDEDYHDSTHQFRCMAVLRGHTTGIQSLKFSDCAGFLFSSAGCEEFHIWRLSEVPVIGTGAVLLTKMPKEVENSDARVMDFDVNTVESENSVGKVFRIHLVYSNGITKLLRYSEQNLELVQLEEHVIGAICLTQIHTLINEHLLICATDGFLRFLNRNQSGMPPVMHKVHQNSIVDMSVHVIDSVRTLVATGGDDNALGLTLVTFGTTLQFETLLIPDAHAAAITGVSVAEHEHQSEKTVIVSAGNDQKVKLWEFQHRTGRRCEASDDCTQRKAEQQIHQRVVRLGEYHTEVADVSGIEVLSARRDILKGSPPAQVFDVIVVGVGIQALALSRMLI